MKPPVLFLVGPTASGKSKIGLCLARRLKGEIISADSIQVYRGMDIGTAKPSREDCRKIPHHLINILPPSRTFSAFEFRRKALAVIRKVHRRGRLPIVVGGSGLYIRVLLEGLSGQPGADAAVRGRLEHEAAAKGLDSLYKRLQSVDPSAASKIMPQDKKRIIRSLEILERSGKIPSFWYVQKESLASLGCHPVVVGIAGDRENLYAGINHRVDAMFRKGLVHEVRRLLRRRISRTAGCAVGYKEVIQALRDEITLAQARDAIKKNTRRLAKRQMTWFRKERGIQWIEREEGEGDSAVCRKIISLLQQNIAGK